MLSIEEVNGMTEGNVKLNSLFEFVETGEENGRLKGVLKKMNDIINVSKLESSGKLEMYREAYCEI